MGRRLEAGFEITLLLGVARSGVRGLEDLRRLGPHGLFNRGQMRQDVPFDADQADGIASLFLGERGDRGHLVTRVHDLLSRVDDRERRFDPRRFLRGAEVDALDPRVRVGRPQDLPVEHAGPRDVV
jgi:hypothetical protein